MNSGASRDQTPATRASHKREQPQVAYTRAAASGDKRSSSPTPHTRSPWTTRTSVGGPRVYACFRPGKRASARPRRVLALIVQRRSAGVGSRRTRSRVNAGNCVPFVALHRAFHRAGPCGTSGAGSFADGACMQAECPQGVPWVLAVIATRGCRRARRGAVRSCSGQVVGGHVERRSRPWLDWRDRGVPDRAEPGPHAARPCRKCSPRREHVLRAGGYDVVTAGGHGSRRTGTAARCRCR